MISATVLAKNSEETLPATLESLRPFPEVLLLDTGSTDKTLQIANSYPNVRIVQKAFQGFGRTHNLASQLATHDWILSIDSDEVLSPQLAAEILSRPLDPKTVYSLDRHNLFQGKHILCWHPDPVIRLYHRKETHFTDAEVHEKVIPRGSVVSFSGKLIHIPYRTIDQFISKMQLYSTLFADQNAGKKHSSLGKALIHSLAAFFKSYLLKRGFLSGKEGFIISLYNAHTAYYKYLKLSYKK